MFERKLHEVACDSALVTASVRHAPGANYAVLNAAVLSNPRHHCQLIYRLDGQRITFEKQPGVVWMEIATVAL
ncbi:MAG: hypothetical protein PHQ58_08905 [Rhodoferax sp.]|uniref:hypothetical protein n=1 Tax=Rhodoferax sp. TaxID=50421 RepID=UPI0026375D50|nr:hypothetical protein [Rhodoferax sp.]MDD2880545.1 hypothetical protein [Rhodoferax sp.]